MQRLPTTECREWCALRGYRWSDGDGPAHLPGGKLLLGVPAFSRAQMELARCVSDSLPCEESLLWVTDWPVYLPDEMLLFKTLFPAAAELIEAPGLLFTAAAEDRGRLTLATYLLFAFNWQGYLLTCRTDPAVWLADEVVEVRSADQGALSRLARLLQSYGVRVFE